MGGIDDIHPVAGDTSGAQTRDSLLASVRTALAGQYTVERELGRGGMGVVFLARDDRLDRQVAVKVLPPELARQETARERFIREARMAARLSHPNIVPVYRADELGGLAFFAMEYIAGETLATRIRNRGVLTADEVVRTLRDVAWALAYAHARGIIHRDIKPENILIESLTGRALVTDFGIARADTAGSLTADGNILGTVHYMSPEQASGKEVDGRSDLYMLGCVGYVALSGRFPFDAGNPQGVLVAIATRAAPPLGTVAPHVPPALAAVIDKSLSREPEARYANGEEFAAALGRTLGTSGRIQEDPDGEEMKVSGDDAMRLWKRAAELQAEATGSVQTSLDPPGTAEESNPPVSREALPGSVGDAPHTTTDGYNLRDVEDAAIEAGISRKYVAIALDELRQEQAGNLPKALESGGVRGQLTTLLLGPLKRRVIVSRTMAYHPRTVLLSLGRTLRGSPYKLEVTGSTGGDPLSGGTIIFRIPDQTGDEYRFMVTRYFAGANEIRISITPVAGRSDMCEVTAEVDLLRGRNANFVGYGIYSTIIAGTGGAAAAAIAAKAALLGGVLLGIPLAIGVAGGAAMGVVTSRYFYEHTAAKTREELERALLSVEASLRSYDLFGELPQAAALPPP